MSTEYYTGMGFEKAKARLEAANTGEFAFEVPVKSRYVPECQAFILRHVESGSVLWCLKETRELHHLPHAGVLPPIGTLMMEALMRSKPQLFIPWIEKTLGLRVMSGIGLPWEMDT